MAAGRLAGAPTGTGRRVGGVTTAGAGDGVSRGDLRYRTGGRVRVGRLDDLSRPASTAAVGSPGVGSPVTVIAPRRVLRLVTASGSVPGHPGQLESAVPRNPARDA